MLKTEKDFGDLGQGVSTTVTDLITPPSILPKTALHKDHSSVINDGREIFDVIDTNYFSLVAKKSSRESSIETDNSIKVPIGSVGLNARYAAENKMIDEKLRCFISWGFKRMVWKYGPTIKLSEEALKSLDTSPILFMREYGDSFVSKVILGARWDAVIDFTHLDATKQQSLSAKLELYASAQGVLDSIHKGDIFTYRENKDIRITVYMSKLGGLKNSLTYDLNLLKASRAEQLKSKVEREGELSAKNEALENARNAFLDKQKEEVKALADKNTIKIMTDKFEEEVKKSLVDFINAKEAVDAGNMMPDALSKTQKLMKQAESNYNELVAKLTIAKIDLAKKEEFYLEAVKNTAKAKRSSEQLEASIKDLDLSPKLIVGTLKNINEDIKKLEDKIENESAAPSSAIHPEVSMTMVEFIDYYKKTLNDIEKIKANPGNYSFDPVEYTVTPYHCIESDKAKSDKLVEISNLASNAKDIIQFISACKLEAEDRMAILQNCLETHQDSDLKRHALEKYKGKIEKFLGEFNAIRKKIIENIRLEPKNIRDALDRVKEFAEHLNNMSSISDAYNPVCYPDTVLQSEEIHGSKSVRKETTHYTRGLFASHHWHEREFPLSNVTKDTTSIIIEVGGNFWGTLKFGYKTLSGRFEELSKITETGKFAIALPKRIMNKILNSKKFMFRHALLSTAAKPAIRDFTIKIYKTEKKFFDVSCIVDFMKNLDSMAEQISSVSSKTEPAKHEVVAGTVSKKMSIHDVQKMILPTKGEGDCAFHAALGKLKDNMVICDDVNKRRAFLGKIIRNAVKESSLFPIIVSAVQAILMSDEKNFKKLREAYHSCLETNKMTMDTSWKKFEVALKGNKGIVEYINTKTPKDKKIDNFKSAFQACLNLEGGALYGLVYSDPALKQLFEDYKTTAAKNFDLAGKMAQDPSILAEYADYISKPKQGLLPLELELIAQVFGINIIFRAYNPYKEIYSQPESYQDSAASKVGVCFDGYGHFEQIDKHYLNGYALPNISTTEEIVKASADLLELSSSTPILPTAALTGRNAESPKVLTPSHMLPQFTNTLAAKPEEGAPSAAKFAPPLVEPSIADAAVPLPAAKPVPAKQSGILD